MNKTNSDNDPSLTPAYKSPSLEKTLEKNQGVKEKLEDCVVELSTFNETVKTEIATGSTLQQMEKALSSSWAKRRGGIRNYMLQKMEELTIEPDKIIKKKLGTVVIAGGGPSGVEIAGMLAEMRKTILHRDYPELTGFQPRICLVDGAPALLSAMSDRSQKYTHDILLKIGVEVRLNTNVKDYINDTVILADGDTIETRILFWTAGVTARTFEGIPRESYGRGNRLLADEYNKVTGTRNIYAIGDTCLLTSDRNFPRGHPQLAQVALQQGKNLAVNLAAALRNQRLSAFAYDDKGSLAIIGRNRAVADIPKPPVHLQGFIAWVTWLFVHLFSLITYRNRFMTVANWAVAFFTKDQSLRMIIRPRPSQPGKGKE